MRTSTCIVAAIGVLAAALLGASAQSVAHKNSRRPNVAAVCAATKSAWSNTASCNALQTGICSTVQGGCGAGL